MNVLDGLGTPERGRLSDGRRVLEAKPNRTRGDVYEEAVADIEAMRLTELGARSILVHRLTGIPQATAKRLYRRMRESNPPGGQAPFTDTWYLQSDQRMLHANIVWQLHAALWILKRDLAEHLIDLYESYLLAVKEPVLDIGRVEFVSHLIHARIWEVHDCRCCGGAYIGPVTDIANVCPSCRLQRHFRCMGCNAPLKPQGIGRPVETCPECGSHVKSQPY